VSVKVWSIFSERVRCKLLLGRGRPRETKDPPLRRRFEAQASAEAAPSTAGAVKRRRSLHRLIAADLAVSDSAQKQTGVTSVSRPFRRNSRSITSSAFPHTGCRSNLTTFHHGDSGLWPSIGRSTGDGFAPRASLVANSHKQ
jgi:hypothetical protein